MLILDVVCSLVYLTNISSTAHNRPNKLQHIRKLSASGKLMQCFPGTCCLKVKVVVQSCSGRPGTPRSLPDLFCSNVPLDTLGPTL